MQVLLVSLKDRLGSWTTITDAEGYASQKVLDLRDLADGVYAYTVYCGKLSQIGKLAIVK